MASQTGVQPSERLASLGITEAKLRVLLKTLDYHDSVVPRGVRGALNWILIIQRGEFLGLPL